MSAARETLDGKAHPALRLQRPLKVDQPVRIARGLYKGREGIVDASLTNHKDTQWITGGARYAVMFTDGRILDYCRYELNAAPRSRT